MQKFTKDISDFRKKFGEFGNFLFISFLFQLCDFLSFESMFTENVNLKCNMPTGMYNFTFLSRKIEYIQANVRDILPVLLNKQLRQSLDNTTPKQASWMQIYGVSV